MKGAGRDSGSRTGFVVARLASQTLIRLLGRCYPRVVYVLQFSVSLAASSEATAHSTPTFRRKLSPCQFREGKNRDGLRRGSAPATSPGQIPKASIESLPYRRENPSKDTLCPPPFEATRRYSVATRRGGCPSKASRYLGRTGHGVRVFHAGRRTFLSLTMTKGISFVPSHNGNLRTLAPQTNRKSNFDECVCTDD